MTIMSGLARKAYGNAPLSILVVAVAAGVGLGGYMLGNSLTRDPTIVYSNKRENPHPFAKLPQTTNIKLYAVNQKFEGQAAEARKRPEF
ncbi:hypothetical protein SmJEL517_g00199 [Synchytrium microbalum]|uniref:NADH dehydrogenase [ubiquinone] 1 alpha subcomplex subunit 4 n=1 Tax=Synchytrium microbalum TaxID=1806994 RepID=A0A507CGM4_9FUNG|nr:uncharacterized protein SmJEL517_g00199 [Synchytrium microbalum]TPX38379.1 hypothetical protein SmJEL517_g00199 [Synchytrium microbalum]